MRNSYRPHPRVTAEIGGHTETRQEFAEECDVNTIMRRYKTTGIMPTSGREPQYGDFMDLPDFMEAQNTVIAATEAFMALPADVRKKFDNDPAAFLEFAQDPANIDEMRHYGLAKPAEKQPETPPPEAEAQLPT